MTACGEKNNGEQSVETDVAGAASGTEDAASSEIPESSEEVMEEMTAQKLVEEMAAAAEGRQMTRTSVTMEMEMSMESEGVAMTMAMSSTADTMVSMEPYAAYTDTTMTIDMDGQQITETSQVYMLEEEGKLVNYTHADSLDMWQKLDTGMSLDEIMVQYTGYDWMKEKPENELALAEGTQMVGDREVYVMNCTLTGQEMQQALNGMSNLEDMLAQSGLEALDYTALTVPTVYYIDAETYLPVQMDMTIEGMSEMMNSLMSGMLDQTEDGTDIDMSIDISDVKVIYTDISYDPVEVPAVPEEGVMIAEQAGFNPDQGDGTYIIQESGAAARITCPEGWTVTDMAYDGITMQKDDSTQLGGFTMYKGVTGEDFISYVEEVDVQELIAQELYISHEAGPVIGEYETMQVKCQGLTLYYAWGTVGDGQIFINVADYNGLDIESVLNPLLEIVEKWDL